MTRIRREGKMTAAKLAIAAAGMLFAGIGSAFADEDAAQIERGKTIADRICWTCHVIGPDQEYSPILREPGPDFRAIAARPNTSAESLSAFLHTTHRTEAKPFTMPNPALNDEMIAAVVSYILSLKPRD
jgi:mono/diheme cytochrome c family protein